MRAGFSFGVVDAFFVRAADDAVGNYNRPYVLCFDECSDLFSDDRIQTYIGFLREPAFERIGFEVSSLKMPTAIFVAVSAVGP